MTVNDRETQGLAAVIDALEAFINGFDDECGAQRVEPVMQALKTSGPKA